MSVAETQNRPAFAWNAGGWFGGQLGGSAWALLLGIVLLFEDPISALASLGAFAAFNAYGLYLWRSRDRLSAYGGIQQLLLAAMLFFASVLGVLYIRQVTESHTPFGVIPVLPPDGSGFAAWKILALPPAVMLWFWLRRREAQRSRPTAGGSQ